MKEKVDYIKELAQRGCTFRDSSVSEREISEDKSNIVKFIATSETPARVFDFQRWEYVDEVLLMDGFKLRSGDQVPFCDSHNRSRCADVFGRAFNWTVKGDKVEADVEFANDPESQAVKEKYRSGILTDCSIGYIVDESVMIPENERQVVNGREFAGPIKVSTKWRVLELSGTPVGADVEAVAKKGRSFVFSNLEGEREMGDKSKKIEDSQEVGAERTVDTKETVVEKSLSREDLQKVILEERARVAEISAMARKFKVEDKLDSFINSEKSIDAIRKEIMDSFVVENQEKSLNVDMGIDQKDKFFRAASDSLLIRTNLGESKEKEADGARELAGLSLPELAREMLRISGQNCKGTRDEVVKRALSTSDLPNVLANTANKSMNIGWEAANETWNIWCDTRNVADFKTQTLVKLSESSNLERVYENGEYKHGDISDEAETYKLLTYGKEYTFGRHMIINDDLNALSDWMMAMGEAAMRQVGDLVYSGGDIVGNATMGDGTALFHADHGNLPTGATPSITSVGAAVLAMAKQTDIATNRRLNIRPEYFIAPKGHEVVCEQLFRSALEGTQARPNIINPYAGSYFTRVYEIRLDPSSGNLPWYLAARKGKTVTVCFLEGSNQRPILERQQLLSTDGVKFRVTLDACAFARDYRGLLKNVGA